MGLRSRFSSGTARQLRKPEGLRGRLVGRLLNRGNRPVVKAAVGAVEVPPGGVVADLGFGGGVGLALLLDAVGAGGRVVGVDFSATMLEVARSRFRDEYAQGRLALHEATMLELPLPDNSLDGLITINTIYFIEDLEAAFAEMSRVLKPGGRGVIGIGDPEAMAAMPFTQHGFRVRAVDEVARLLEGAGLQLVGRERVGEGSGAAHLLVATRS